MNAELMAAEARLGRAAMAFDFGRTLARGLEAVWQGVVARPFARWLARERMIHELSMLSEHELAELGIARGMIPYVADEKLVPGDEARTLPEGTPANENASPRKAA
jgi:uncharacterized protein YjiS (DUF1127 family)